MTKLFTLTFAAVAALALPALASQPPSTAQPASAAVMAIGNPHTQSHSPSAADSRAEQRRQASITEWQGLLGGNQPYPAMGVGGHAR